MLLATRALGLGSTLTTRHIGYAKECDEAMGIPPNYHSYAILPIGYPMGRFGPVGRGPLSKSSISTAGASPIPESDQSDFGMKAREETIGDGSTRRSFSRPHNSKPPGSGVAMLAPTARAVAAMSLFR